MKVMDGCTRGTGGYLNFMLTGGVFCVLQLIPLFMVTKFLPFLYSCVPNGSLPKSYVLFPIGLKMYAMSVLFLFQHFTYPVFQTGPKKMLLPPFKLNCKYSMKREIK